MTIKEFGKSIVSYIGDTLHGLAYITLDAIAIWMLIGSINRGNVFISCLLGLVVMRLVINRASEAWHESD